MPSFSPKRASPRVVMLTVTALLSVMVIAYVGIGILADSLAESIPDATEVQYFGSLGAAQKEWSPQLTTPARKKAARVFDMLRRAKGLRALDYKLYFMKDPTPNAFSLPGGSIGVTEGLLAIVDGEIGLGTVLGHELGHQQYRHSLRMMGRSVLLAGLGTVVLGGQGNALMSVALSFAESSHSRKQDLEADAYGLTMVHDLMGTTKGALEFFEKIERDPRMKGGKFSAMLSSHPYTPDRIKKLKDLERKLAAEDKAASGADAAE